MNTSEKYFLCGEDVSSRALKDAVQQILFRMLSDANVSSDALIAKLKKICDGFVKGRLSLSEAGIEMYDVLQHNRYAPTAANRETVRDLNTIDGEDLILKTYCSLTFGCRRFIGHQGALDLFPCQEIFRAKKSAHPQDWAKKWSEAGGKIYNGRMIAEVNAPVWRKISRFDLPFEPFDFKSGMTTELICIDELSGLGISEF